MATGGKTPARLLPLLYFGTAHAALACACAVAGLWPRAVAGFFYHSWMLGIVHLITLGWITFSILGAIYIVGPLALRMDMDARRGDYAAWAVGLVGIVGLVGHFWIGRDAGMAWSAATVGAAVLYMTVRIIGSIWRAGVQPAVKLHIVLACANIWIAATLGILIAWDKVAHFLPGFVLAHVFAHAHLAAVGWATMMVVGVAYRLLPMTFPSKMPAGRSTFASAILIETGVLGLFTSLLLRSNWAVVFGGVIVAGLAAFGAHVVWMLRHPVSKPAGMRRPDFGVLHAAAAAASLVAAAAIGLTLAALPTSPATLRAAGAYGVLGLVGFLGQFVVAMERRLLPSFAWRTAQELIFVLWLFGVPALAIGLAFDLIPFVRAAAWALLAATVLDTITAGRGFAPVRRG